MKLIGLSQIQMSSMIYFIYHLESVDVDVSFGTRIEETATDSEAQYDSNPQQSVPAKVSIKYKDNSTSTHVRCIRIHA